jgi:HEAT repeat protein
MGQHEHALQVTRLFKSSRDFATQLDLAKEIVRIHDASVLPELEPYLTDENRHARGNAAVVFAGFGDDRGFDTIAAILKDYSPRPMGQGVVIACNGEKGCSNAQILADRHWAVQLLGDLKDPRAVPVLVPLLKDHDVQDIVPWSLALIRDHAAVAPLIETLHDPNPEIRWLAIQALAVLKAKEALPALQALVNDEAPVRFDRMDTVGSKAARAIDEINDYKTAIGNKQ